MASMTTYMTSMVNCMNDVQRDTLSEVKKVLESKDLLTDEISDVLTEMLASIKTNKKVVKKEKKPRFSGYHLFMKEHRVVVKEDQPGIKPQELTTIVSKAWKDIPEEQKEELNARALRMKEEYNNTKSSTDSDEAESSKKPAAASKKGKAPAVEKKPKKKTTTKPAKKVVKSPPSSDDEDDEPNVVIEEAESDIDI